MKNKAVNRLVCLSLFFLILFPYGLSGAEKKVDLVGREALNFTLPSTLDRLINYGEEYYGKHHLIITFFPAAFTPI